MPLPVAGQVGPSAQWSGDGSNIEFYQGKKGDVMVSELHGRFYEQNYRGSVFGWGKTSTALSANSITLSATTTPIIGVWNPSSSLFNLVVLQASIQSVLQAASSTTQGALVWAASTGNGGITTGNTPWNRKALAQSGSAAKGFDLATALTGLTNNLVIFDAADLAIGVQITTATVAASTVVPMTVAVQNFDGSLIVPPGGVLALLNTTSTTNINVAARIMWEEVPL